MTQKVTMVAAVLLLALSVSLSAIALRAPLPDALFSQEWQHNFGLVRPTKLDCKFVVRNGHAKQIDIVALVKSCGCTTATIDKQHLRHGDTATVTCTYDVRGRAGDFATTIDVLYKEVGAHGTRPKACTLAAYANVDPVMRVSPARLTFHASTAATTTIAVEATDNHSVITSALIPQKAFTATVTPDKRHVTLSFDPSKWGAGNGSPILIVGTDCPFEDRIRVPVTVYP